MAPFSLLGTVQPSKWTTIPEVIARDLSEKTILVVGANVGLGLEASRHLARMKPKRLILACRNVGKGEAAAKDIAETTGYTPEVAYVDLLDFSTIPAFIEKLDDNGKGKVDLAICNAALNVQHWQTSKDGWESCLQVNHLSTVLLSLLLLPILSRSKTTESSPRLTIVASDVHYLISLKKKFPEAGKENMLEALNTEKTADMRRRYFVTKLFTIFFTRALVERLPNDTTLGVDAVNPGLCRSKLRKTIRERANVVGYMVTVILDMIARTTEVGSRMLINAALERSNKEVHGKYLNKCQIEEESDLVISKEGKVLQDRLWKETLDVLIEVHPPVKDVVTRYLQS